MFVFHFPTLKLRDSFLASSRSFLDVQGHDIMCQIEAIDPTREVVASSSAQTDIPELSKKSVAERASELGITTSALESALFAARVAFADANKKQPQ